METRATYQVLKKPAFAPPSWVFGPVWTILYILIAVSFGRVFWGVFQGELPLLLALPFILNLIFNFSFTYFQFRLKNNFLASLDILLVLGTLIWGMIEVWALTPQGLSRVVWVTYINIPHLLWVSFATVLQLKITRMNR